MIVSVRHCDQNGQFVTRKTASRIDTQKYMILQKKKLKSKFPQKNEIKCQALPGTIKKKTMHS